MAVDTVPMLSFGNVLTVAANTLAVFPLWQLPNLDTEFEGVVDDDAFDKVTITSIVGTIHIDHPLDDMSAGLNVLRIMPLTADLESGTLIPPFLTWSMWSDPGPSNLRFLWERIDSGLVSSLIDTGHLSTDDPWHRNVNIRSNLTLGVERNLWPALLVENNMATETMRLVHRLRAFCRYR